MRNQEITSVFEEVQARYEISNIAEVLGITFKLVGRSLRSDSIDGSGEGKDAFAIYPESNRWYDFKLGRGGDIVDFGAQSLFEKTEKDSPLTFGKNPFCSFFSALDSRDFIYFANPNFLLTFEKFYAIFLSNLKKLIINRKEIIIHERTRNHKRF